MGEREDWIVMPFIGLWEKFTKQALIDCLQQEGVNVRILAISNGSDEDVHQKLQAFASATGNQVLAWHHQPPLPSLSATWNRALEFVWQMGGEQALVVNNDVRLNPHTYATLLAEMQKEDALLVSATGLLEKEYVAAYADDPVPTAGMIAGRGGPDFSCFLISKECHQKYHFDENFIPAFCEDLDFHRRLLIDGERARIFGMNVPFHHINGGSNTVKHFNDQEVEAFTREVEALSRAYYEKKWLGGVNTESTISPFHSGVSMVCGCTTTPELQFCDHEHGHKPLDPADDDVPLGGALR